MKNFNNNFDESFKFNLDVLQKAKDLQRGGFNGFSFNLLGGFSGLYKILLWLVPTVFVGIGAFFVPYKRVCVWYERVEKNFDFNLVIKTR